MDRSSFGVAWNLRGSEAGSYLRLIYFVNHSTLGLRVIKKKKNLRRVVELIPVGQEVNALEKVPELAPRAQLHDHEQRPLLLENLSAG